MATDSDVIVFAMVAVMIDSMMAANQAIANNRGLMCDNVCNHNTQEYNYISETAINK